MIITDLFESHQSCPECGGPAFSDLILAEKKDACYYKVKASAKVWPSAYASGRLVQCRKKGADNYGKSKNEGVAEGSEEGNLYAIAIQRYPQLKQVDRETVINALNNAYEDYLMHYGYEGIGPDEESSMIDYAVKGLKQGVAEGEVKQFPKKHRGDLEDTHSCVKCGGDLQGGTYMGNKVKVCIPCKQVYLPPNTGIDQRGNKVDEQGVAESVPSNMGREAFNKKQGKETNPYNKNREADKHKEWNAGHDQAAKDTHDATRFRKGVAEAVNTGPHIIYATGPRTMGVNDVDLVFKDLRTGKIVASVVGNNYHPGDDRLQEFAPPDRDDGGSGGESQGKTATYEIRMNNSKAPTYVAFGDPEEDTKHKVYKLGPKQPGAQTYYGHGLTLVSNLDYWSFLEKMLGDIMYEDDAIEAGYVDRNYDGDLVFLNTQQDVAEKLGDNRPKLGSRRDAGKSIRKWRSARGLDETGVAEGAKEDMSKEAKAMASGKCPHCHGPVEKKEHPTLTQYHCAKCGIRASIDKQGVAEEQLDEKCWDGYQQQGTKNKGGRQVPNCVPAESVAEDQLAEKSVSQAQFRTMAAAAHNPKFAKKVGISPAVAKEFHGADRKQDYTDLPKKADESKSAPKDKEADYGDDYQAMVARVKKLAGLGPLKTVYDPQKRVYRNVPTAVQPKK